MVNVKYIITLVSLTLLLSIVLQLTTYVFVAFVCEVAGLQADNSLCQLYFHTGGDTVEILEQGNMTERRWCLLWRDGGERKGQHGIRCFKPDRLFSWLTATDGGISIAETTIAEKTKTDKEKIVGTLGSLASILANANKTTPKPSTVRLPSLEDARQALPLLQFMNNSLEPKVWITRKREPVELVITLSLSKTMSKTKDKFLTLDSLFQSLPPRDQHKCIVLVFITEIFKEKFVETLLDELVRRYDTQIETGLMDILIPRENFYMTLVMMKKAYRRDRRRNPRSKTNRMRRKSCMDHVYMMLFGQLRGKYYLQLSDDATVNPDFLAAIQKALVDHASQSWAVMSFSYSAVMGKLLRSEHLPQVAALLSRLTLNKTVDYHLANFILSKGCGQDEPSQGTCTNDMDTLMPLVEPVLFEPVDAAFAFDQELDDDKVVPYVRNPMLGTPTLKSSVVPGYLPCSTIRFTDDLLPVLFPGGWPVKVHEATRRGRIDIKFSPPADMFTLTIKTGLKGNSSSAFREDTAVWAFSPILQKFTLLGNITAKGQFEVTLPPDLQKVQVVEITFGDKQHNHDVYLTELTASVACRGSTRIHLSSTSVTRHSHPPAWYTPGPQQLLPRREGDFLIAY